MSYYLCLSHISVDGMEQKYNKGAFDTNWGVPLGPNVNGFEKDLEELVNKRDPSAALQNDTNVPQNDSLTKCDVVLNSRTAAVHLGLLTGVPGIHVISLHTDRDYDSNFWLRTITIDPDVRIKGQENTYKTIVKGAVGGAAGVIHIVYSAVTDCQPNYNVETLKILIDVAGIEACPVWKPMHKQPCYKGVPCYLNCVSEVVFKVGMCLPAVVC